MSGLVKAKKYNWKDSNVAMFGSDTDREVKKAAAETEPAWKNAGKKPGLQIWRINKFKVETWPTDDYGEFYEGDSYIILNTYKDPDSDKLLYDVHFWIGKYSTQDEYGTAAYKTVELDTLLDDVPVQHREVQNNESETFKEYFKEMTYMKGGADTGFRRVTPEQYKPRLLKVFSRTSASGKTTLAIEQVKVSRDQITSDDVYILDDGNCFYQFNGKNSSRRETYRAAQQLQRLRSARPKSTVETIDEEEAIQNKETELLDRFYEAVERADAACDDDDDDDDEIQQQLRDGQMQQGRGSPKLLKLHEEGGNLQFDLVKEGDITKRDFNSADVFILDTPKNGVFVWVGRRASKKEKANGMAYATTYLQSNGNPCSAITCMSETQESREFRAAIAA